MRSTSADNVCVSQRNNMLPHNSHLRAAPVTQSDLPARDKRTMFFHRCQTGFSRSAFAASKTRRALYEMIAFARTTVSSTCMCAHRTQENPRKTACILCLLALASHVVHTKTCGQIANYFSSLAIDPARIHAIRVTQCEHLFNTQIVSRVHPNITHTNAVG